VRPWVQERSRQVGSLPQPLQGGEPCCAGPWFASRRPAANPFAGLSATPARRYTFASFSAYLPSLSRSAARGAKYVRMPSAPARLKASRLSSMARSPSIQPFCAAASIIEYSPDT